MTPVELLNAAADRLDALAYGFAAEQFWQSDVARADLSMGGKEWAEVMSPAVAAPLAAWLCQAARRCKFDIAACSGPKGAEEFVSTTYGPALTLARLILGEEARDGR